ncbi:hypothetical protein ACFQGA_11490 [Marinobacter koreensis]|uniref:Uncharacterized protein n=1 Tax=Marinobacter koreensis TaxID=335974 RepID=A0ABW0RGG0_9GAMM|nr:hypothetical protein [Marinobacter koreensis]MCK7548490.1 hypothetical protein [Marinobacter koreensis]
MAKNSEIPPTYSPDWLQRLDGRTRLAQAVNQRYQDLTTDLGGNESLSYQRRSLCKQVVWMEAIIEQQHAALSRGEEIDQGKLTQATNTLIGLLKTIGLDRVARDIPNLQDYLKAKQANA